MVKPLPYHLFALPVNSQAGWQFQTVIPDTGLPGRALQPTTNANSGDIQPNPKPLASRRRFVWWAPGNRSSVARAARCAVGASRGIGRVYEITTTVAERTVAHWSTS
jgi:hypothetical protein